VEQHQINKSHSMFKTIDELCFKSKNLYNYANYIIRQEFIFNHNYINYYDMKKELKTHDPFKDLGSQASQQTLEVLDRSWKSFFVAIKDWSKYPQKYLGRPRLPNYKKKDGRNIVIVSNTQSKIADGFLKFSWKPFRSFKTPTKVQGKLMQVRFVPRSNHYIMEIVYQINVPECIICFNRCMGIDLGINNFATISNNIGMQPFIINGRIVKSINQYYNKKKANLQSGLMLKHKKHWSNRLQRLTDKRNNKVKYFLHKSSKYIIEWAFKNKIDTIVVGRNKFWKQNSNMGKKVNQSFTNIPFEVFIEKLKYKAENIGIKIIETEESYTSGTSFLDNELPIKENYNKSRRIHRGLFRSNTRELINADLNGAYQIMKKVFPNTFVDGIEGVHLHPIRVNI